MHGLYKQLEEQEAEDESNTRIARREQHFLALCLVLPVKNDPLPFDRHLR